MAGLPGEQSEGVVAVEGEQRTAQVPDVGRVTLALTFAGVRVDAEVHGAPSTTLAGGLVKGDVTPTLSGRPSRARRQGLSPVESASRERATSDRRTRDPSASTRRSPLCSDRASAMVRSSRGAWR